MAKLRIQETLKGGPSEDGYVLVVDNLIFGAADDDGENMYRDFLVAEPDERVDILKEAATVFDKAGKPKKTYLVTHLKVNGGKGLGKIKDETEEIDSANCRIFVERDKRKRRRLPKSRFTIALPEDKPKDNVDYLQPYAEIIHKLYSEADAYDANGQPDKAAERRSRAHRFMFGMMLLTRCR
jgi:hypothetical protein